MKPEIRISTRVPDELLAALGRVDGEYSSIAHVFHCIRIDADCWIGVAGDGDNSAYEHFVWKDGKLTISNCGYGSTDLALKEVINQNIR